MSLAIDLLEDFIASERKRLEGAGRYALQAEETTAQAQLRETRQRLILAEAVRLTLRGPVPLGD